ncbi:hypothetical protein [Erythrobacter sp. THAF29]|uniref:hypothetical protein n=1 Tax=Erythrobacter sp. THAF29 TaxID=2587851 RepID=UPI001268F88C|nr:hypothetical protein [Erythrobacter sp. THAF29]QFT78770.1 hypothetical protein FIU90_14565 [Erythrobacter sp. THAF29]
MKKPKPDRFTRTLAKSEVEEETRTSLLAPSPNPATNLLIADIVVRGAASLFRQKIERRVAKASYRDDDEAEKLLDGKTLITTLGLYGASKLATRSPLGLGIVATGLVAKTLYDRGKARQRRKRERRKLLTRD